MVRSVVVAGTVVVAPAPFAVIVVAVVLLAADDNDVGSPHDASDATAAATAMSVTVRGLACPQVQHPYLYEY